MPNVKDSEQLISEMRECASLLQKFAYDESFLAMEKNASISGAPVESSRAEYMAGLMAGLSLEN